jgi:hypothetical protein
VIPSERRCTLNAIVKCEQEFQELSERTAGIKGTESEFEGLAPSPAGNNQVETTPAQAIDVGVARAQYEQAPGGGWDRSSLPDHPECCGKLASNSK